MQIVIVEVLQVKKAVVMMQGVRRILIRIHAYKIKMIQSVWKSMIVIKVIIREEVKRKGVIMLPYGEIEIQNVFCHVMRS